MRISHLIATLLCVGPCTAATGSQAAESVPTYLTTYEAFYSGRRVGETQLSVTPIAGTSGAYEFRSVSRVRGIYRLLAPRPVEELSNFVVEDGMIRPLEYTFSNGNRGAEDNIRIDYDWNRGRAT